MEDAFSNVIILGNGFDLNLGLETAYSDFIESKYFKDKLDVPLFSYLNQQRQIKRWIDLEVELKHYAQSKKDDPSPETSYIREFQLLCRSLKSYLKDVGNYKINQHSIGASFLREKSDQGTLILNFNYTDTVKLVLKEKYLTIKELKIHGSCNKDIILGVEDEAVIPKHFIFLKKSTSSIYLSDIDYNKILLEANNIYFFGYSLGETDHSYFKDFFSKISSGFDRKHIVFYYYQEEGKYNIDYELDTLTLHQLGKFKQKNRVSSLNVDHSE